MTERKGISKSVTLCGESDAGTFQRTFEIIKRIDSGASGIVYSAKYKNGETGTLKEFYPEDAFYLKRDKNNQLVCDKRYEETKELFEKKVQRYISSYKFIYKLRSEIANDNHQYSFFPPFEIYRGCDENGNVCGSVYIWTHIPELITFEKMCGQIHSQPTVSPEKNLLNILRSIESLTESILLLHSAGYLHRDIKPSNFGFVCRHEKPLTDSVTIFDMDSVCSVYDPQDTVATEGFCEPEVFTEYPENKTDIYSVGAVLFYALIITDETKKNGFLYQPGYFSRLKEMVDSSELISISETNSHPRLRQTLADILKGCLSTRSDRYRNCEQLLEDIRNAIYYVLPPETAERLKLRKKWEIEKITRDIEKSRKNSIRRSVYLHLFQHPLYTFSADDSLDIMLVGCGSYGQSILDICLQTGQMPGKKLNITVVSMDETDKECYLSDRTLLDGFFNVDGSLNEDQESYGNIHFVTAEFSDDEEENKRTFKALMTGSRKKPNYIISALGDKRLSFNTAKAIQSAVSEEGIQCLIGYIWYGDNAPPKTPPDMIPIRISENVRNNEEYKQIERMAFNAHLIWEKNLCCDLKKTRKDFRSDYYYHSSISNVLSIKYKLFGIKAAADPDKPDDKVPIDLDKMSFTQAAAIFNREVLSKKNSPLRYELIYLEHRRWVTEKLCEGWKSIDDLSECVYGGTKDKRSKRHVCIVRSRAARPGNTPFKIKARWDTMTDEELAKLDDLDRMSVLLHREYKKESDRIKQKYSLEGSITAAIKEVISGSEKCLNCFLEWESCFRDIWNHEASKFPLYQELRDKLLEYAENESKELKNVLREQIEAFESIFMPIVSAVEYRDYKNDDFALVDGIPFILTYSTDIRLAVPFSSGDNTEIFANIAAASVINPSKIYFLCLLDKHDDPEEFKQAVKYTTGYMKRKNMQASAEFIIAHTKLRKLANPDQFKEDIKEISEIKRTKVEMLWVSDELSAADEMLQYLKNKAARGALTAIERNDTALSRIISARPDSETIPHYKFDIDTMKFHSLSDCSFLSFISKKPYITVADMAAFTKSTGSGKNPEFFAEYKTLWDKYKEATPAWKRLCDILKKYSEDNDTIVSFKKREQSEKTAQPTKLRYIIPFNCRKATEKIICFLIKYDIAEKESCIQSFTTESFEVLIYDRYNYTELYDTLFGTLYALMLPDSIIPYYDKNSRKAKIKFDGLFVKNADISGSRDDEINRILSFFDQMGYIINLNNSNPKNVSFVYAASQIKELLTTAGRILEIYTYHKAKEVGVFSDVVCGYTIKWDDIDAKNEFDCIITKNFSSMFIECKARRDIEFEFYSKLKALVEHFGINAKLVLIADTGGNNDSSIESDNQEKIKLGSRLEVITVTDKNDINNIGITLKRIFEGTYQ